MAAIAESCLKCWAGMIMHLSTCCASGKLPLAGLWNLTPFIRQADCSDLHLETFFTTKLDGEFTVCHVWYTCTLQG